MDFLATRSTEVVSDLLRQYAEQLATNPQALLKKTDSELTSLYTRYGNDWTGRGYVGDVEQEATIAALEAVRAECLARVK